MAEIQHLEKVIRLGIEPGTSCTASPGFKFWTLGQGELLQNQWYMFYGSGDLSS
jgi:hypothetical protein